MWDTQKEIKAQYAIHLDAQHGDRPFYEGALHLEITFYFKVPKTRAKQYNALLDAPFSFRPDLSNLIKLVEDVATGILYKDDSLITSITAHKKYSDRARTEFYIKETK
jgi:Holliday junction resolvase RusA-like endonuclease